jgi:hypothetical protein
MLVWLHLFKGGRKRILSEIKNECKKEKIENKKEKCEEVKKNCKVN